MGAIGNQTTSSDSREFIITRVFDAPRDLVWKAFTEPAHLNRWWGPKEFTTRVESLDLRPGGVFRYSQQMPDGKKMWGKWVYQEIAEPKRMVTIVSFTDAEGNPIRYPMEPNWPLEMLSIATFSEHKGKTTLTIEAGAYRATEHERKIFLAGRGSMEQGFTGTLDRLADYLATVR